MTEKRFNFNGCNNCIEFDGKSILCDSDGDELADVMNDLNDEHKELKEENEQLKSELSETKEILRSIEKDRNQTLLVCKKYEGFFKEKGYDIHDLIDYARDGSND